MDMEVVERQGTNVFFPSKIPSKRKNRQKIPKLIVSLAGFIVGIPFSKKDFFFFLSTSVVYNYLFFIGLEIVQRLCSLCDEFKHVESRYEGKLYNLFRDVFTCNNSTMITTTVSVCLLPYITVTYGGPIECIESCGILPWIMSLSSTYILSTAINIKNSPLNIALCMDSLKGLDYGSGMANSFFYGYLNFMLPCTGDERKGLKEHIEDYESKHNVKFGSKKLHILIPLSAHCRHLVDQASTKMLSCPSLDWVIKDRAGVRDRRYHNSVYKIMQDLDQDPVYVCAEYATPLLTLYEVMGRDNPESKRYKRYKREIVTNFFMTLHKIISENRDCNDMCELIYYRDIDDEGNGLSLEELDIGELLLDQIQRNRIN